MKIGKLYIGFYSLTKYLRSFSAPEARCAHDPRSPHNPLPWFTTCRLWCGRRLWIYYGHSGAFHFDFIWTK